MTQDATAVGPLHKTVTVPLSKRDAFELFTTGIARWWPLRTHSVSEERASSCVLEGQVGGRIYEVDLDGREIEWGRVLGWDPPRRVVYAWFPGRNASTAQEVEVRFTEGPDGTTVELEHRGWETLGERAVVVRSHYESGWDFVLRRYAVLMPQNPTDTSPS